MSLLPEEASTLFLGDLSVFCTEKDIRKLFRPFGPIESIRVKRGSSNKTNLSYGFIKFALPESAEQSIKHLNGVMFLGRGLRIGWAAGKNNKLIHLKDPSVTTAQVHVSYISKQIDVLISEATLRGLFSLYGEVVDVALKKSQFDRNLKIQNGYGFIHYALNEAGVRAAITAVQSLHQVTIDRVTYDCSVSHALEDVLGPQYVDDNPGATPLNDHGFCLPGVDLARGPSPGAAGGGASSTPKLPTSIPVDQESMQHNPSHVPNERRFVPKDPRPQQQQHHQPQQQQHQQQQQQPLMYPYNPAPMHMNMNMGNPFMPTPMMIGRPPLPPPNMMFADHHSHSHNHMNHPYGGGMDFACVPLHMPSSDGFEIPPPINITARSSFTSQESLLSDSAKASPTSRSNDNIYYQQAPSYTSPSNYMQQQQQKQMNKMTPTNYSMAPSYTIMPPAPTMSMMQAATMMPPPSSSVVGSMFDTSKQNFYF